MKQSKIISFKFTQENLFFYFSIILIILIGLLLRWINIDIRPLHHDESLHALYGKYIYIAPKSLFYKYDPLLHGPLLYNILPFIFNIFGFSNFAIRFLPALIGSIVMFTPLMLKNILSKRQVVFSTLLISLSPTLIYWSRFLRHDYLVIFFTLSLIVLFIQLKERKYFIFSFLPIISLHFCIKENAYVHLFLLIIFCVTYSLFSSNKLSLYRIIQFIKNHKLGLSVSLVITSLIYIYFYSAKFLYFEGVLDGLYKKSLVYWFKQHHVERLKGPFIFQTLVLSIYEFPIILLTIISTISFYLRASRIYLISFFMAIVTATSLFLFFNKVPLNSVEIFHLAKLKIPLDFFPFILILIHGINTTIFHAKENNFKLSFFSYFYFGSLFTYSFLGEKVPWLSIYPLMFSIMYLTLFFKENRVTLKVKQFNEHKAFMGLLIIVFCFNLYKSLLTNFSRAGKSTELLSQVHTTMQFEKTILKIKDQFDFPINGQKSKFYTTFTWPTSWYLYGYSQYHFSKKLKNLSDYHYIITENKKNYLSLSKTHYHSDLKFRHWWVPDYKKISWPNFFDYLINQRPWNKTGVKKLSLYTIKDKS